MQLLENTVSPKFGRKVKHIKTLEELSELLGAQMRNLTIPLVVEQYNDLVLKDRPRVARRKSSSTIDDHYTKPIQTVSQRPMLPPPRRANVQQQAVTHPPSTYTPPVPPRRINSPQKPTDVIIYEDTEAERHALKKGNIRSSSAPLALKHDQSAARASALSKGKPSAPLRRAISGPLTPLSSTRQNHISTAMGTSKTKLTIRGKEIKVRTSRSANLDSKVGGLKALFEDRAAVAQSLR